MQLAGPWEGSNVDERGPVPRLRPRYASEETEFDPRAKARWIEGIRTAERAAASRSAAPAAAGRSFPRARRRRPRLQPGCSTTREMRRNHAAALPPVRLGPSRRRSGPPIPSRCRNASSLVGQPRPERHDVPRLPSHDFRSRSRSRRTWSRLSPHNRDHFRDYEVGSTADGYFYTLVALLREHEPARSGHLRDPASAAASIPVGTAETDTSTPIRTDVDVEDFDPENTLETARKAGWDFALVTDHNSLGAYFRSEDQGTPEFIVSGERSGDL